MSTAASVAARNAANAKHSTGPVTAEGKARSAQNALKHGLAGNPGVRAGSTVVLPYENRELYDTVRHAFFAQHRPATELEKELVGRMVDCWWRLTRALRVESEFFAQRIDAVTEASPDLAGDAALANLFTDPAESKRYRLFLRYLTNAQNAYRQACADFQRVKKERLATQHEESLLHVFLNAPPNQQQQPEALTPEAVFAGSVSQSAATPPATSPHSGLDTTPKAA